MASCFERFSITTQRAQFLATHTISSDQVYQDAVLWLPLHGKRYLPQVKVKRIEPNSWWVSKGIYAHPILVLSRPASDPSTIELVLLTSLGDTKGERRDDDPRINSCPKSHYYLPIEPAEGHACYQNAQLGYCHGRVASARGYVSFQAIYSMKRTDAQPYADFAPYRPPDEGPWVLQPMHTVLNWAHDRRGYQDKEQYCPPSAATGPAVGRGDANDRPRSLIARVGERMVSKGRDSWGRRSYGMRHN